MNTNKKLLYFILLNILIIINFSYSNNKKLYDKNGFFKAKIIKIIYYSPDYELNHYIIYYYENNLLKKCSHFDKENNLYYYITYDEFDANNNPIKYSGYLVNDNKTESLCTGSTEVQEWTESP